MRPCTLPLAMLAALLLSACSDTESSQAETETPQVPEEQEPDPFYVGIWAADPVWCTDQTQGFPITIEPARFLGRENVCDMSDITATPEGGWTASLSCQAEGSIVSESLILAPAGEQLAITWPDRTAETTLFSRCE